MDENDDAVRGLKNEAAERAKVFSDCVCVCRIGVVGGVAYQAAYLKVMGRSMFVVRSRFSGVCGAACVILCYECV